MKLIIAGGRDYSLTPADFKRLTAIHAKTPVTEVISGGATGADRHGELWAIEHGIPIRKFPADWLTHGPSAGPIRNREMAAYADALAVFSGGRGTASMVNEANLARIQVYDFRK